MKSTLCALALFALPAFALALVKMADGWKIRHSHTSSRARRPTP